MEERILTPAEKAQLFNQSTRQHIKALPNIPVVGGTTLKSIELPNVRLTSRILLMLEGTVNIAHATLTSIALKPDAASRLIRNIRLSINNGFNPFQLSGRSLYTLNQLFLGGDEVVAIEELGNVSSVGGTDNTFKLFLELPLTLNQRDAIGLVNTANLQTIVNVIIDTNALSEMFVDTTGFTITSAISLTPTVESFSVPANPQAIPDLSILKLVHEFNQSIPSTGDFTFQMQTGLTYRKILVRFEDATGAPMTDTDIGNLELVFNQADFPYTYKPSTLRALNQKAYNNVLEPGVYVFDLTNLGFPNFGGSRDYVDTERLTEFWLKTNLTKTGKAYVVTETLARLGG